MLKITPNVMKWHKRRSHLKNYSSIVRRITRETVFFPTRNNVESYFDVKKIILIISSQFIKKNFILITF